MAEMNEALLREVNPIYLTVQSCLLCCARLGDADSKLRQDYFSFFDEGKALDVDPAVMQTLLRSIDAYPWFCSTSVTDFFLASGITCLFDVSSGYTARAFALSRQKDVRYSGCDLPAVAEAGVPSR